MYQGARSARSGEKSALGRSVRRGSKRENGARSDPAVVVSIYIGCVAALMLLSPRMSPLLSFARTTTRHAGVVTLPLGIGMNGGGCRRCGGGCGCDAVDTRDLAQRRGRSSKAQGIRTGRVPWCGCSFVCTAVLVSCARTLGQRSHRARLCSVRRQTPWESTSLATYI